jgi:hypothetical protein
MIKSCALALTLGIGMLWAAGCGKTTSPGSMPADTDSPGGYQKINSDAIYSVKYDEPIQTLTVVTFEEGVFDYEGVPKKVFEGFMAADDKDGFWQQKIKDKFKAIKF